MQTERMKYM